MTKLSAAAIALLVGMAATAPASAQMGAGGGGGGGLGDKESPLSKQEKLKEEERKAIERDYDKTMKRLKNQGPSQAASNDPWAAVRPAAAESKTEPKKR